jgi:transcription-repair coupling factor (superfamily II helicase)
MIQNQEISDSDLLIEQIVERQRGIDCIGLSGSGKAYLTARVYARHRTAVLVILPTAKEAERFLDGLRFFSSTPDASILYFPPYNILPFTFLSYHNETASRRIRALYQLLESRNQPIVVTSIDALLQKIIPRQVIAQYAELILKNEEIDRDHLIDKLICGGYIRSTIVEEPGDFSVRGSIVDIFTPLYTDPLRIEFFGDQVDAIRFFSAASQRKIKEVDEAIILPAKEVVLNEEFLPQIINRVRTRANELDIRATQIRTIVDRLKNREVFSGIESLISFIYPRLDTLFDYVPPNSIFMVPDAEHLERAANKFEEQISNNYAASCEAERICDEPNNLYLKWQQANELIFAHKPIRLKALDIVRPEGSKHLDPVQSKFSVNDNTDISSALQSSKKRDHHFKPLVDWLDEQKESGCASFVVCRTPARAERLNSILSAYGVHFTPTSGFPEMRPEPGLVYLTTGQISSGFVWKAESLAIITEEEIFGVKRRRKQPAPPKPPSQMLDLQDLKKSDFIVHDDHGIGQYDGLLKLKVDGLTSDFLSIVYKGGDKLYLPVDRMSLVQKYMGVEGIEPGLDKMGGKSWERIKARVKRSAEKIAGELLKLYARRTVEKGLSFQAFDADVRDFESGFAYDETTDQIKAIEDVLNDMQQSSPMDRLVCGDVGYGKTEVALRAAFLSVNNNKQTAMLVPTTILAEQHYATFKQRFAHYPVNIACLSRFRSPADQRNIIEGLKTAKIDIVIGTHRLLQKDIEFKDLGLLVLDEEQRFGVKHKEKLKKLRSSVDVLTLTATPIPRTLHMSLMGIRDISIISTPPEYRQSIITYISEFDEAVIAEAITRELNRNGQIFFVHNNINSIANMATKLKQLVPEVNLAVAHARLDEGQLEGIMYQFMNKEIDLLVCTSIIESGLDIPSANTIIVNRADRFGLAQMYQLRGRVGRADEQAYAYLLIPHESSLTKDAQKRLKVLMEHSDLGSGFQIAMNDLKIRGGGTILGASQSGHIAAVGYDMFLKLMEFSIAELKGQPVPEKLEPEINVSMSAFFPDSYIPDLDQRLIAYRRLAKMDEVKEIGEFQSELIDRYGNLPDEAGNLLFKIALKVLAKKAGITKLDLHDQQLMIQFSETYQFNPAGLAEMVMSDPQRFELKPTQVLIVKLQKSRLGRQLVQTKNILKEIVQRVNS